MELDGLIRRNGKDGKGTWHKAFAKELRCFFLGLVARLEGFKLELHSSSHQGANTVRDVDFCMHGHGTGEEKVVCCLVLGGYGSSWEQLGTELGRHGAYGARHLCGTLNVPVANKYPIRNGHGGLYLGFPGERCESTTTSTSVLEVAELESSTKLFWFVGVHMGFGYTGGFVHPRLGKGNTTGNFSYGKRTTKSQKQPKKTGINGGLGMGFFRCSLFSTCLGFHCIGMGSGQA